MKKIIIIFMITGSMAQAQNDSLKTSEEYYLEGVMETASGFRLLNDSTFDFFYSYGAIDREGKGTWEQRGDSIFLNGKRKPEKDFRLTDSKKKTGNQLTIKISDPNKMILRYVSCRVTTHSDTLHEESDTEGIISFPAQPIKKIELVHRLWADRVSAFDMPEKERDNNYFEFAIERWIADVEFNNFFLVKHENTLTGQHPLLEGKEFVYEKGN